MEDQPESPQVRLLVIEMPVPGVLTGQLPLPEPADLEIGWSTTDPGEGW